MNFYTSRSQFETTQDCKRKGFYNYLVQLPEMVGPGLQSKRLSIPLTTGGAIHVGLDAMLRYKTEDECVGRAVDYFRNQIIDGELVIAPKDGEIEITNHLYEFTVLQELALIEGLLRMFYRRGKGPLLKAYEILEVEKEGTPILIGEDGTDSLQFQYRTDALMRNRVTGELALQSYKTASYWGKMQKLQFKRDNQGLSEAWSMERQFDYWHSDMGNAPEWYRKNFSTDPQPPGIAYTLMTILLKGSRKEDKLFSGMYNQYSPLIRGYKADIGGLGSQYAWSWNVPKVDKSGREYEGNIGNGFKSFKVWAEFPGGVKAWIDLLDSGTIQLECGDPLAKQMEFADPIPRSEWEKQTWASQMIEQESKVWKDSRLVNRALASSDLRDSEKQRVLDFYFPQTRGCCGSKYGSMCQYERDICFDPTRVINPMGMDFRTRINHHEVDEESE